MITLVIKMMLMQLIRILIIIIYRILIVIVVSGFICLCIVNDEDPKHVLSHIKSAVQRRSIVKYCFTFNAEQVLLTLEWKPNKTFQF